MLRIIVNCGPAEEYIARCLASIRFQSFSNWQAYVTVDPCGDRTYQQAVLAKEDDPRIHIHRNGNRQYTMVNLIRAVRRSGSEREDVIVVLDGDDWLATPDALLVIHDTYRRSDCWMTYGSWISDQPKMQGRWPAYPDELMDFRNFEWLGTAVRTWKRWLWDFIDDRDFRNAAGKYFRVTEDQAAMLPMLEMSGTERAKHIPEVLMVYNRTSPYACVYTCRDEMLANGDYIKTLPPYSRLIEKPESESAVLAFRSRRRSSLRTQAAFAHSL
ncbi:MAG TPA: glycosyltransferase family A protein [Bryobacteraceae bacterium]|nr:glycosyltransferase family A protein [Bryobacteraceae bacterium]